eukprot:Gb_32687 [translate_table: standard]
MSTEKVETNAVDHSKRTLEVDQRSMNPNKLLRVQESEAARKESSEMSQRSGVQRYLVAVEYIGTNFVGMQKQPNCRTVQGVLEGRHLSYQCSVVNNGHQLSLCTKSKGLVLQDAFSKFIGQPVSSANSSRTDPTVVMWIVCCKLQL